MAHQLDTTFQALADPTRRAILSNLKADGTKSLSDLAAPFGMSLPGVMKHVGILESAGLLEREKVGRTVFCTFNSKPMSDAMRWLQEMEQFWSNSLDSLALHVETESTSPTTPIEISSNKETPLKGRKR